MVCGTSSYELQNFKLQSAGLYVRVCILLATFKNSEECIGVTRTALAGRENGSRRQRERFSKGAKAVRNSDALGSR